MPPSSQSPPETIELATLHESTAQNPEQEVVDGNNDEETSPNYPIGIRLWFNIAAVLMVAIVKGLDLTIVAVAVPSLTDQFRTVSDIGWYLAAYGLCVSAFTFFFGSLYVAFPLKHIFLLSILIFTLGSTICTFAPTSSTFIVGRAFAGLGSSGIGNGVVTIISHLFPLHKRPLWFGIAGGVQSVALVCAPLLGGVLIDSFGWRACFGINLPVCGIAAAVILFGFRDPVALPQRQQQAMADEGERSWEKIGKLNFVGTAIIVPCLVCLLLSLQWGGSRKHGWDSPVTISLLVTSVALFIAFVLFQRKYPEKAVIPARIWKNRSIIGGAWFEACCDGTLAVTEYYISIYFQGVRGFTATKSALLGVPLIVGLMVAIIVAGVGTTRFGYYTPFMFATTILAPIPAGILTTLDPDEDLIKSLCCIGTLGIAIGLGISAPQSACQMTLSPKDIPLGNAMLMFGGGMGSAVFVSAASVLFQNRLFEELGKTSTSGNMTLNYDVGLTDIRNLVSPDSLKEALAGYNTAVVQTLYLPLALAILTIIGSLATEWKSVKQKVT